MKNIRNILLFALVLSSSILFAQELPAPMNPRRMVNDFVGLLNQNEWASLETKLRNYNDSTSNQIAIVIVNDFLGFDKSDYAFRLAEKWGVGGKGKNNGVMIIIKPKVGNEKGDAFIAIGYSLEDVIPDITANQIVNREMIPSFKKNNFYQGLDDATTTIINLAKGKFTADQYNKRKSSSKGGGTIIFIIIIIVLSLIFRGNSRNRGNTIGSNIPFWLALGMLSSGSRGGGFGNFSSGSGGFEGFGGGSFGGGGAGGSW
ncbi:MAG: TPM domain-containing protein [Bacteroidales bacterium]|nr:TPM domain-containing protein [Bacteroidales bacterium]